MGIFKTIITLFVLYTIVKMYISYKKTANYIGSWWD